MYSEQVKNTVKKATERRKYSELKVMHSPTGYYIGTTYQGEHGIEPGSRDSGYLSKKELADTILKELESGVITYSHPLMRPFP